MENRSVEIYHHFTWGKINLDLIILKPNRTHGLDYIRKVSVNNVYYTPLSHDTPAGDSF